MSVQTKTTQFTYTETGKLLQVQDVFVKGKDSKFYQEVIASDKKLRDKYKALPEKVYFNYHFNNTADTIKLITRINEKGDTISQSTYTNNGLTQQYKEFGKYGTDAVTNYITNTSFVHLPISLAYKSLGEPYLSKYEYLFDGQSRVVKLIARSYSFDEATPYSTDTYFLEYDNNGLLLSAKNTYVTYQYEYEFYK